MAGEMSFGVMEVKSIFLGNIARVTKVGHCSRKLNMMSTKL